jgi:Phytanoyl-CoA dioxygenase (PhyH)
MTTTAGGQATPAATGVTDPVRAEQLEALRREGITGQRGAFTTEWVDRLAEDVDVAFAEARNRPRGAVGRGTKRYYVEIHPEQLRGFVDLVTHPWVTSVCEAVLGPDYTFVEVGFDVPLPGALDQPWHRDFAAPDATLVEHRYTSLAFNLTAVDTAEDMGPFEIAPGTQFDAPDERWKHGMFPPEELYGRYTERAERRYPRRGDVSARTALTLHRGTANTSRTARPVLVLGAESRDADKAIEHSLAVSRAYWDRLPEAVRRHLDCPVVDELVPIVQRHEIEGLVMGDA